ncbi:hypothetical protein YC2023_062119 [Brassica napus]
MREAMRKEWMLGKTLVHPTLTYAIEIAPIQSVIVLIFGLYVVIAKTYCEERYVSIGSSG